MRLNFTLALIIIFIACYSKSEAYRWKYKTTAHELIKIEEDHSSENETVKKRRFTNYYKTLDFLIDACKKEFKYIEPTKINDSTKVSELMRGLDMLLARNNFFICVEVSTLSEGLSRMAKNSVDCYYANFYQSYREASFNKARWAYHIDCDLGSIIYLSIGEVLNFPISFVEVPNHNFVRWNFSDGSYINWDVNRAQTHTDDDNRKGYGGGKSFSEAEEVNCRYLQNLGSTDIKAYYYFVVGRILKGKGAYQSARNCYELALDLRKDLFESLHAFAYMLIFVKQSKSQDDFKLANRLAIEANVNPNRNSEYLKTLACTYAAIGNFQEAIHTLEHGNSTDDECEELKIAFQRRESGIEVFKRNHNVFN